MEVASRGVFREFRPEEMNPRVFLHRPHAKRDIFKPACDAEGLYLSGKEERKMHNDCLREDLGATARQGRVGTARTDALP